MLKNRAYVKLMHNDYVRIDGFSPLK